MILLTNCAFLWSSSLVLHQTHQKSGTDKVHSDFRVVEAEGLFNHFHEAFLKVALFWSANELMAR
jgi:hypothetical protein